MIEYVGIETGGLVAVRICDSMCQHDYEALIPEIEKKIKDNGRINFYLEIKEGLEWDNKNFWSNMHFNLKHAQDFRKVAFVGDEQMEEKIVELFKPFENAEIRWYTPSEKEEALKWIKI